MQNEFLGASLAQSRAKVNQQRLSIKEKQFLVRTLQEKNQRLHKDIKNIERIMKEKFSDQETKEVAKRQNIITEIENPEVLNKEISNCYKRIKQYEIQIEKLKQKSGVSISDRIIQVNNELKQKRQVEDKMREQLLKIERQVKQNSKKLSHNNIQSEMEKKNKNKSEELKFLKDKIRDYEEREQIKQKNLKSEFAHIKKLEKQFLQSEGSMHELQAIKKRAINAFEDGRLKSINRDDSLYEEHHPEAGTKNLSSLGNSRHLKHYHSNKFSQSNQRSTNLKTNESSINQEEAIEDRTRENYQSIVNEIRVLEKLDLDYQKQLAEADYGYKESIQKTKNSKQKLALIEKEIKELEGKISLKKSLIVAGNLKPLRSTSLHNPNKIEAMKSMQTISPNESAPSKPNKRLKHTLKFDSVGLLTNQGFSFTDRNFLGPASSTPSLSSPSLSSVTKITSLIVHIDKQRNIIGGIQAIYNRTRRGAEHIKKNKSNNRTSAQTFRVDSFQCADNDYIKEIGGTLNLDDKLESLSVVTQLNRKHVFGEMKNSKKGFMFEIDQNEVPVCIFGSLKIMSEPLNKEFCAMEYFGVEIASLDDSMNNQSSSFKETDQNEEQKDKEEHGEGVQDFINSKIQEQNLKDNIE